jgi:hypothetical protein
MRTTILLVFSLFVRVLVPYYGDTHTINCSNERMKKRYKTNLNLLCLSYVVHAILKNLPGMGDFFAQKTPKILGWDKECR